MKKWMVITSVAIASLATAAGHLSAVELSEEGCTIFLMANVIKLEKNGDEKAVKTLLRIERMARKIPEDIMAIAIKEIYCEEIEIAMELYGIKENSPLWNEFLHWSTQ